MTSTTITRSCDFAVSRSESMARRAVVRCGVEAECVVGKAEVVVPSSSATPTVLIPCLVV